MLAFHLLGYCKIRPKSPNIFGFFHVGGVFLSEAKKFGGAKGRNSLTKRKHPSNYFLFFFGT
jgi:hypothetical protein